MELQSSIGTFYTIRITGTRESRPELRIKGPINQYVVMRIAQIRRSRGLSRKKVAELTGIPHSSYTCLEGGWYKTNLDNLWKILGVLEANIQEVWPQAENKGNFRDDGFLKKVVGKARKKWEATEATYGDVVEAVAHVFRLEARALIRKGKAGSRTLSRARCACGFLVQDLADLTITGLCRELGHNVSSMSHMMRRQRERMEAHPDEGFLKELEACRKELQRRLDEKRGKRRS